jgi:DNA polymerase elongation subunit (family B)
MSRKVFIDTFFNQFTRFIGELSEMYPDDTEFPVFMATLNLLKSTNPMLVINFVKTEIIDLYETKIIERDENFFINEEYSRKDINLDIIKKLKQYIVNMTTKNKEIVWCYIEILMKLCKKILE